MRSDTGLTLIEVLVAIVILAVGVLAAATMQTTALRASNDAKAIQGVTKLAEGELELRRSISLSTFPGNSTDCQSVDKDADGKPKVPTGYTCGVVIRPCGLSSTTPPALSCPATGVSNPVADQATVTVNGPRSKTIALKTVKAR